VSHDSFYVCAQFILHSWRDEKCVTILRNCYQALPVHGKVIAVDNMLPETVDFEGADPLALQCDIHMMVWNDAGGENEQKATCASWAWPQGSSRLRSSAQ
jgi:hypothetical protein